MKKRRVKLLALALTASLLVPQALPVTAFSEDELAVQYVTEDYEFSDGEDCVTENFVAEDVATEDYGVEIYQEGDVTGETGETGEKATNDSDASDDNAFFDEISESQGTEPSFQSAESTYTDDISFEQEEADSEVLFAADDASFAEDDVTSVSQYFSEEPENTFLEEEDNSFQSVSETTTIESEASDPSSNAIAHSGQCGENVTWKFSNGVMTISGTGNMWNNIEFSSDDIPWDYTIDKKITKVVIEDGVMSVGKLVFADCYNVESVVLPDSIKKIETGAFEYCKKLKSISLPDNIKYIGQSAFSHCDTLETVVIPESLPEIGYCAFSSCASLRNIIIPEGYTEISEGLICNCPLISNIKIPETVTKIGEGAFSSCTGLETIDLPNGVTTIEGYAFSDCTNLKNINIPKTVSRIEEKTFENCKSLEKIVLPESIEYIGFSAFKGCTTKLGVFFKGDPPEMRGSFPYEKIVTGYYPANNYLWTSYYRNSEANDVRWVRWNPKTGEIGEPDYSPIPETRSKKQCGDNLTYTLKNGTLTISGTGPMWDMETFYDDNERTPWANYRDEIKKVVIESGATSIGMNAFYWCTNLTSISLPTTLKRISDSAFSGCKNLKRIKLPNGIDTLGPYAFDGCESLTDVNIPSSTRILDQSVFHSCYKLKKIVLPAGIKFYGGALFEYCNSMSDIYFKGDAPAQDIFPGKVNVYYPKNNKTWSKDFKSLCAYNEITWIPWDPKTGEKGKPDKVDVANVKSLKQKYKMTVGEERTFQISVLPSNAKNKEVTYSSDNPKIATVSKDGKITAKGTGYTIIYAKSSEDPSIFAKAKVVVYARPSVKLNETSKTLYLSKAPKAFVLKLNVKNGTLVSVKYTSGSTKVATVNNSTGKVAAKGKGTTKITAKAVVETDAGKRTVYAKCEVTVR